MRRLAFEEAECRIQRYGLEGGGRVTLGAAGPLRRVSKGPGVPPAAPDRTVLKEDGVQVGWSNRIT